jgi:hypothetical protein
LRLIEEVREAQRRRLAQQQLTYEFKAWVERERAKARAIREHYRRERAELEMLREYLDRERV